MLIHFKNRLKVILPNFISVSFQTLVHLKRNFHTLKMNKSLYNFSDSHTNVTRVSRTIRQSSIDKIDPVEDVNASSTEATSSFSRVKVEHLNQDMTSDPKGNRFSSDRTTSVSRLSHMSNAQRTLAFIEANNENQQQVHANRKNNVNVAFVKRFPSASISAMALQQSTTDEKDCRSNVTVRHVPRAQTVTKPSNN